MWFEVERGEGCLLQACHPGQQGQGEAIPGIEFCCTQGTEVLKEIPEAVDGQAVAASAGTLRVPDLT